MSSLSEGSADTGQITHEKPAASESTDSLFTVPTPHEPSGEEHVVPSSTGTGLHDVDLSYRAPTPIAWRCQPLWDQFPESLLFLPFALFLSWLTLHNTASLGTTALVAVVFLATSHRAWLPTAWEVNRDGVVCHRLGVAKKWPWRKLSGYELDRRGVLLMSHRDPQPWHYLRSVHVPWGPHQDQLLALVTHYMGSSAGETSGPSKTSLRTSVGK